MEYLTWKAMLKSYIAYIEGFLRFADPLLMTSYLSPRRYSVLIDSPVKINPVRLLAGTKIYAPCSMQTSGIRGCSNRFFDICYTAATSSCDRIRRTQVLSHWYLPARVSSL
jgi:hypothetical protein